VIQWSSVESYPEKPPASAFRKNSESLFCTEDESYKFIPHYTTTPPQNAVLFIITVVRISNLTQILPSHTFTLKMLTGVPDTLVNFYQII
jgi:hypothetical protein